MPPGLGCSIFLYPFTTFHARPRLAPCRDLARARPCATLARMREDLFTRLATLTERTRNLQVSL
jgi:hypothetical protein